MSNIYYEPSIWYGEGKTTGWPYLIEEGYEDDYKSSMLKRNVERAVFKQIENLFEGIKPQFFIDGLGELQVKIPRQLPEENKEAIKYILSLYKTDVYSRHQFKDFDASKYYTKREYKEWFDKAKESYFITMPFKQLLTLSDYDSEGKRINEIKKVFNIHDNNETYRKIDGLEGYSTLGVKNILENCINPYILLSSFCNNVHIEEINNKPYVLGITYVNGKEIELAVSLSSKEIYRLKDNKLKLLGNSYEYMFKSLYLPIRTVLNTTAEVVNPSILNNENIFSNFYTDPLLEDRLNYAIGDAEYEDALKLTKKSKYKFI